MKVGDRIRVFELNSRAADFYQLPISGLQRPELNQISESIQILSKDVTGRYYDVHFSERLHLKQVSIMVIKSIKNEKN